MLQGNIMHDQELNQESPDVANGTIVILTRDRYLFYGLKSLINALAPELLSKTSTLYDVVNVQELMTVQSWDTFLSERNILIADYDIRLAADGNLALLSEVVKRFKGVVIIADALEAQGSKELFIPRQGSVDEVRSRLLDVIRIITTGRARAPQDMLNFLTNREMKLLKLIMSGTELSHIARMLEMNVKTVYAHRSRLYKKAGVSSLQQLYTRLQSH